MSSGAVIATGTNYDILDEKDVRGGVIRLVRFNLTRINQQRFKVYFHRAGRDVGELPKSRSYDRFEPAENFFHRATAGDFS